MINIIYDIRPHALLPYKTRCKKEKGNPRILNLFLDSCKKFNNTWALMSDHLVCNKYQYD